MDSEAILGPKWKPRGVLESGEHVKSDFDLPAHLTLTFEIGRPTPARDWLGLKWKMELTQAFLGLF